jgi:hypothetical protein
MNNHRRYLLDDRRLGVEASHPSAAAAFRHRRKTTVNAQSLIDTARALVAADKGLLAMDESNPNCNK